MDISFSSQRSMAGVVHRVSSALSNFKASSFSRIFSLLNPVKMFKQHNALPLSKQEFSS
jgi:hypothetical protein